MVKSSRNSGLSYQIQDENHTLISDVPQDLGGTNLGMTPHRLLEAALAACTSITVQMYADRKKINLESVDTEVHTLSEGAQSKLSRKILFRGGLNDEEKNRLLEIANKCPIHRLLISQIEILTEMTSA